MTDFFTDHLPRELPLSESETDKFIAPYWADVDIRGTGQVYYRETDNSALLARATNEIRSAFSASKNVNVTSLFIVTWESVGYFERMTDKV